MFPVVFFPPSRVLNPAPSGANHGPADPRLRHQLSAASAALILVMLVGCSTNKGPSEVTTIVFDGQRQALSSQVTCTAQPDGKLVILAIGGSQETVRVALRRDHRLVVEKVGLHVPGAIGFVDDSDEVWATKVDDTYTINGRMPPNPGEVRSHQFTIGIVCRYEVTPSYYRHPSHPVVPR